MTNEEFDQHTMRLRLRFKPARVGCDAPGCLLDEPLPLPVYESSEEREAAALRIFDDHLNELHAQFGRQELSKNISCSRGRVASIAQ